MVRKIAYNPHMILSPGTQIVTRVQIAAEGGEVQRSPGVVGEIVKSPRDHVHSYRVRFVDGAEAPLRRTQFAVLKHIQRDRIWPSTNVLDEFDLMQSVVYRCIVGSRAYGLSEDDSDVDRRGIYVPPADMHWSLYGVPEQLENPDTEECYWELQKFVTLALKANPNVLECLYTPLVEEASPIAQDLLALRKAFLSKLVYQTYNGYVLSQFKKLNARIRNHGEIKWKHAMHLIRLLLAGIKTLEDEEVPISVEEHRSRLLAIRRGETSWPEADSWRLDLHKRFDEAFERTRLPDRPDYEQVNGFLIRARRSRLSENRDSVRAVRSFETDRPRTVEITEREALLEIVREQPHPLIFVTISGAHLYGFPSSDSDYDLRGVHILPLDEIVGLGQPRMTIECGGRTERFEQDLVTHDALKFFRLLLKNNGYVLEQLYSPFILQTTPEHEELRDIAHDLITRNHAHHYLGFARKQWGLFEKALRVKPLLYVYRVLLTGIHLMRTGQVESNLVRLNESFRLGYIRDLVSQKIHGAEKGAMKDADIKFHRGEYERLIGELEAARDASALPISPQGRERLNDLLLRLRKGLGKAEAR